MIEIVTKSVEETEDLGKRIASKFNGNEIVAFFGGMGMGKTTFIRGMVEQLGNKDCVSSPTFAIVHEYNVKFPIYHFDMYRINSWDELYSTGFFDYINNGILLIEWSENIESELPSNYIKITISKGKLENERIFLIEGFDKI